MFLHQNAKSTMNNRIGAEGGKTKLVEMGGKPITAGLSKSVNFRGQQGCVFSPKCNIDPEKDCRISRLVYEVECIQCTEDPNTTKRSLYLGTSGHLLHKRQMEHIGDLRRQQDSNALQKHQQQMHPNTPANFRSRVVKQPIQ